MVDKQNHQSGIFFGQNQNEDEKCSRFLAENAKLNRKYWMTK